MDVEGAEMEEVEVGGCILKLKEVEVVWCKSAEMEISTN